MGLPEPDIQVYYDELNNFLTEVGKEIQSHSQYLITDKLDQDSLEAYLLDLNTYYYRSFHERFFPVYKSKMEADIRAIYRIKREESELHEDIISNLKRMAQVYNRVKSAARLLSTSRDSVQDLLNSLDRGQEQRIVELLYTLKDLDKSLSAFLNLLSKWQNFLEDHTLLDSLAQYPFHLALNSLLLNWEADNSKFVRDFKRLMINLQLAAQLLLKLQYSDDPCSIVRNSILDEFKKLEGNLAGKKSSPFLVNWYKQHIQSQFLIYLELLELYAENNERKKCVQTAQTLGKWLQALLYLLEKASLSPQELGPLFFDLQSLALLPAQLNDISELIRKTSEMFQELIKELSAASNPGFEHFSTAAKHIITEAYPQFRNLSKQGIIPAGTVLYNGLDSMCMQISLLDMQVDLLSDKEEHRDKLRRQYHLMLLNMDSYLELLLEAKNELARALAPRNLSRNFKDIELRVEHIIVNQGEIFPAFYLSLLPEVKDMDNDSGNQDYIVQEEDGDIFIFKLDDLYEELIPHIVLAKEG